MATTTLQSNELMQPLISAELNNDMYTLEHSTFKYIERTPEETGAFTITAAGSGGTITFNIPSDVFNLSKSYITLDMSIAAPAAVDGKIVMFADAGASIFQEVQVLFDGRTQLARIQNLNRYMKATLRRETPKVVAESMGGVREGLATAVGQNEGIFQGLTYGIPVTAVTPTTTVVNATLNNLSIGPADVVIGTTRNQSEPEYVMGAIAPATTVAVRWRFQLDSIKNSIFSKNSTLAWPQMVQLQFVLAPAASVYFTVTAAGAVIPGTAPITAVGAITLSNIRLQVAVEDNRAIRDRLKRESMDGLMVSFDQVNSTIRSVGTTTTTHNPEITVRRGDGKVLKRIYWAPMSAAPEANNLLFYAPSTIITTANWNAYINSVQLYNQNFTETQSGSWNFTKEKLLGSCISNDLQYYRNFCFCVDLVDNYNATNRPMVPDQSSFVEGMPITSDIVFSIKSTSTTGVANHYFWTITNRIFQFKDGNVTEIVN